MGGYVYCNILATCRNKQETAFGGDCFILDSLRGSALRSVSRFGGNDNRLGHLAKVLLFILF